MKLTKTILLLLISSSSIASTCKGRMINPITHVAWSELFPLNIAGATVAGKDKTTPKGYSKPICQCGKRIGIPIGFWQPFRAADVTRIPYCMVNLNTKLNLGIKAPTGDVANVSNKELGTSQQDALYHVHWYIYPLLAWMNLVTDIMCVQGEDFDIAWMTELDPFWNDSEMSLWLNPEAAIFASPPMQLACVADCAAASVKRPINSLFWCSGCRGGVFPLNGQLAFHASGVDASTFLVEKTIFKLHRQLLLHGTVGKNAICHRYPMPWWKKDQYKIQMTYPSITKMKHFKTNKIGGSTFIWGAGKERNPFNDNFGYLIWGRRECCVL